MKSKDCFVQPYNTQGAVDGEAQIIGARDTTRKATDKRQLV